MSSYFSIQAYRDRLAYLCCYSSQDFQDTKAIEEANKFDPKEFIKTSNEIPLWKKVETCLQKKKEIEPLFARHTTRQEEVNKLGWFSPYFYICGIVNKIWGTASSYNTKIQSLQTKYADVSSNKEYDLEEVEIGKEKVTLKAKWVSVLDGNALALAKKVEISFYKNGIQRIQMILEDESVNKDFLRVRCSLADRTQSGSSDALVVEALVTGLRETLVLQKNKKATTFEMVVEKSTDLEEVYKKCFRDFDSNGNGIINSGNFESYNSRQILQNKYWKQLADEKPGIGLIPCS